MTTTSQKKKSLSGSTTTSQRAPAEEMVAFLNDSWTPYHAVVATATRLLENGFREISEKDRFDGSRL